MFSESYAEKARAMTDFHVSDRLAHRRLRHVKERVIEFVLLLAALVSVATTVGIVLVLLRETAVISPRLPRVFPNRATVIHSDSGGLTREFPA